MYNFGASVENISFSLTILEQLGLIVSKTHKGEDGDNLKKNVISNDIRIYKSVIENLTIMDFAFDSLYTNIFDMITKYLLEKKLGGATFPRHKLVVDFL